MSRKNDVGFASHIDEDIKKQQNFDKHKNKYGYFTNYCKRYDPETNKCIGYGGYCNAHRKAHCDHYADLSDVDVITAVKSVYTAKKAAKTKTIMKDKKKKKPKLSDCLTIIQLSIPLSTFEDIVDYTWKNKVYFYETEFEFDKIDKINCNKYRIKIKCGKKRKYLSLDKNKSTVRYKGNKLILRLYIKQLKDSINFQLTDNNSEVICSFKHGLENSKGVITNYW